MNNIIKIFYIIIKININIIELKLIKLISNMNNIFEILDMVIKVNINIKIKIYYIII